jgi:D-glycero-D-manno-heptose 1,7-bisphosphate phosphatase
MRRRIIERLNPRGSFEADALQFAASSGALVAHVADGFFIDIGVPEDFARAQVDVPKTQRRPAVFFDRDGVLNVNHGHVGTIERFEWIPGAREAVRLVNEAGFYAFVVTNQAGIAKGRYTEDDYRTLRSWMRTSLAEVGAHLDDERFCPYHPEGSVASYARASDWRKPEPGMLLDLARRWPVAVERSFLVGDKQTDIEAARRAGVRGTLFEGGRLDEFIKRELLS